MSADHKPPAGGPDIHAAIRQAAAKLRASKRTGYRDSGEFPEVVALLNAVLDAVSAEVPQSLEFMGATYWIRVQLAAKVQVFATPGDAEPLVSGISCSNTVHGHAPGH